MKNLNKYLQDMLSAIESIESYIVATYDEFLHEDKTQDAIMFNLIILGEAANKVPREFQEEHQEIPWSSIIGTRNVIVHGYDQVKLQIVWDIIEKNLAGVKRNLEKFL